MKQAAAVDNVAYAAAIGVDATRLFVSTDPVERMMLFALIEKADEYVRKRDDALAIRVANEVWKRVR